MSLTLAILAAGVGSRFGADKQLQHTTVVIHCSIMQL